MKLLRTHPSAFARVSDFDEWFRHPLAGMPTLGQFFSHLGEVLPGMTSDKLAVDVHEDKDAYHTHFEVPGVKKEDVKIELNNGLLTVTAEKRQKNGESESSHTLSRSFRRHRIAPQTALPRQRQRRSLRSACRDARRAKERREAQP